MLRKICLDPGHGGRDSGAVGPSGLREKDVALAICKYLAADLCDISTVYLTRWDDRDFGASETADLQARCDYANSVKADLFISIHCNSADNPAARGMEVYTLPGDGPSDKLAEEIVRAWEAAIPAVPVRKDLADDDSDKEANFYVLRKTAMPAILVETAFISNPEEEKLLADPGWQQKCARAIANGVRKYLGLPPKEEPPVNDDKVTVVIKGKEIPGKLIDGTTWVPLRALVDALAYKVTWDEATKTAKVE